MMNFQVIKNNLINILGAAAVAAGTYRVIGYQPQGKAASEVKDNKRLVQVFWQKSMLPPGQSGTTGPFETDTDYAIELTVSAAAEVDLDVLNDDQATAAQKMAALAAMKTASENADVLFDDLVNIVFQVLLKGTNIHVGTSKPYPVQGRWIPSADKDPVKTLGDLVVLTGQMIFNCLIIEEAPGAATVDAVPPAFDTVTDLGVDGNQKTGVNV